MAEFAPRVLGEGRVAGWALLKGFLLPLLSVLLGAFCLRIIYTSYSAEPPTSPVGMTWLAISYSLSGLWLVLMYASYRRERDVEHVQRKALLRRKQQLESENAALEKRQTDLLGRFEGMTTECTRWHRRTDWYWCSGGLLASDFQRSISRFAGNGTWPTKEWYCRNFLGQVVQLFDRITAEPDQVFRATLLEWAPKPDEEGPYLTITYYDCSSCPASNISVR